jgi:SSS family solute:Na+ symporter
MQQSPFELSFASSRKQNEEVVGLVYSLTPKQTHTAKEWYKNPLWLGIPVLVFNLIFY